MDLKIMTNFDELLSRLGEASLNDKLKPPLIRTIKPVKPVKPKDSFIGNMFKLFNILDDYSHDRLIQFPKSEKFLLVSEIKKNLINIERILVEIYMKHHKKTSITNLDIEVEILRKYITRSYRRKFINESRKSTWINKVNNFGSEVQKIVEGLKT